MTKVVTAVSVSFDTFAEIEARRGKTSRSRFVDKILRETFGLSEESEPKTGPRPSSKRTGNENKEAL